MVECKEHGAPEGGLGNPLTAHKGKILDESCSVAVTAEGLTDFF